MTTYNVTVINGKNSTGIIKDLTKKQIMTIFNLSDMAFYTYKIYGCFSIVDGQSIGYTIERNKK